MTRASAPVPPLPPSRTAALIEPAVAALIRPRPPIRCTQAPFTMLRPRSFAFASRRRRLGVRRVAPYIGWARRGATAAGATAAAAAAGAGAAALRAALGDKPVQRHVERRRHGC